MEDAARSGGASPLRLEPHGLFRLFHGAEEKNDGGKGEKPQPLRIIKPRVEEIERSNTLFSDEIVAPAAHSAAHEQPKPSLSLLDELILLDIYPAREEPILGVTSQLIYDRVTIPNKHLIRKEELLDWVKAEAASYQVVLMLGAGDIDRLVEPVKQILERR